MPGVLGTSPVANRFPLSALRVGQGVVGTRTVGVRWVRAPDFGHGGNHLSGHTDSVARVVSCHVVGDGSKEWGQRFRNATRAGAEEV